MTTHVAQVVVDALDPGGLARWWAETLGWTIVIDEPDEVEIAGGPDDVNLLFVPVAELSAAKSRVHLDLPTRAGEDQGAKVDRLLARGATRVDLGQGDASWGVLADPEGNELCVLRPGKYDEATGAIAAICTTPEDPETLLDFWAAATGWSRTGRGLRRPSERGPFLVFGGGTPGPKTTKNRVHIDVAPAVDGEQRAEVERLLALGATEVDIGQGDVPWVVLRDPEGNELCVLTPR